MKKITIISAHIDDAIFSLGGIINKWIDEGFLIEIITIFSKTNYMGPKKNLGIIEECMLMRKEEDNEIIEKLKGKIKFIYLDFEEALLRGYDYDELFGKLKNFDNGLIRGLRKEIKKLTQKADYIFFPYGYGNHVDHQVCSKSSFKNDKVFFYSDMLYICYMEENIKKGFNYKFDENIYNKHIDLSNCYKSQMVLDVKSNYVLDYLLENGYTFYGRNKELLDDIIKYDKKIKIINTGIISTKIPKRIISCWFGGKEKNDLMDDCIGTWKKYLPEYEFIEFTENNSPMDIPFVQKMYEEKKGAFLSDYIRVWALYNYGGIYLDTGMEILKPLDGLLSDECFLGFELSGYDNLNTSILGGKKGNLFLKKILDYYDNLCLDTYNLETTGDVFKKVLNSEYNIEIKNKNQVINGIRLYTKEYFYPYYYSMSFHRRTDILENTYAVHHWNNSWGYTREHKKKISIIIPHLNEGYYLDIMLDSFYNYLKYENYEIIICDDGSDDLSNLDFIKNHFLKG
ncbi:MAG: glycosyltransferase [Candidatus Gracilibacteria bacterium]|nr:glycosyltransferase [Candidatus Gracilibacteria bacterium]